MALYHVHPGSGEVKRCWARLGRCPFGGVHSSTAAEARAAYEASYASSFSSFRASSGVDPLAAAPFESVTKAERRLFPQASKPRRATGLSLEQEGPYLEWWKALSPEDRDALELYRGADSRAINNAFRYGSGVPYMEDDLVVTGEYTRAEVTTRLMGLIAAHGSQEPSLLYHGVNPPVDSQEARAWDRLLQPGFSVRFPAFVSAAQSPATAKSFAAPSGVVFELYGAGSLFMNSYEEEELFPPGTEWKIVGRQTIIYEDQTTPVVQLLRKDAP